MRLLQTLSRILRGPMCPPPARFPASRSQLAERRILLHEVPLAGFEYHRAPGVWTFLHEGVELRLKREPYNLHDPNAIAVWFKNDRLGYIPRRDNPLLARLMDRGERLSARVVRLRESDNPWRRVRVQVELGLGD